MSYRVIKNVLKKNERKQLIKDCQPFLIDGKELSKRFSKGKYPGKQTLDNLHRHYPFILPLSHMISLISKELNIGHLKVEKAWVNWCDGKDNVWHHHIPFDYSVVYYMKTFPLLNSGTVFTDEGFIRCPQNSLIVFPSHLVHSVPKYRFGFSRYTLAMDLNISR